MNSDFPLEMGTMSDSMKMSMTQKTEQVSQFGGQKRGESPPILDYNTSDPNWIRYFEENSRN